ncbi:AAA family ATPase [Ornithinimicrobium faecis]|uniref:AAA family ATPase n=1 Tax=Ornithinimicrobium faecis TaxID=2934158 RepID=UPI0021197087|nr:AAA family ATPase [Ornithinimicrobium sp. HY1745]
MTEPTQGQPGPDRTGLRPRRLRILLTGMSAVGKSTLVHRLRELGREAVDLDDGCTTESIGLPGEVLWLEDRVREVLDGPQELLFIAGCASNQGVFRDDFDRTVLLSAPPDVIRQRLRERDTNPFGKTPEQEATVLADQAEVEPLLRQIADQEIVTTGSLEEVVAQVLAVSDAARESRAAHV